MAQLMPSQLDPSLAVHLMPTPSGIMICGELDRLAAIPVLHEFYELHRARLGSGRQAGTNRFDVDLADVTFMDAGGIKTLAEIHNRLNAYGDQAVVTGPTTRTPRWLLSFAVSRGWLTPAFAPVRA